MQTAAALEHDDCEAGLCAGRVQLDRTRPQANGNRDPLVDLLLAGV
jgi:hypothetical protein